MAQPVERLVNLAFFLANSREPVTRERVRAEVVGYPAEQSIDAFLRMFERDKDDLRDAGLIIRSDEEGHYWIDRQATFAREVDLSPEEAATLRAVSFALLEDPSFPYAEALRVALAKISTAVGQSAITVVARTADESPEAQGAIVATLDEAVRARKRVGFGYTNAFGEDKDHEVEPFGLFAHDGRWYLVGNDVALGDVRVYAVSRMGEPVVNTSKPKSPDFERPAGFDVSRFISLPFQYGPDAFTATLRVAPSRAWLAPRLTRGIGTLAPGDAGSSVWTVDARNRSRLLRWIVEMGPGISVADPPDLAEELAEGLRRVEVRHG